MQPYTDDPRNNQASLESLREEISPTSFDAYENPRSMDMPDGYEVMNKDNTIFESMDNGGCCWVCVCVCDFVCVILCVCDLCVILCVYSCFCRIFLSNQ